MIADVRLRRFLSATALALAAMAVGMPSDGRAQDAAAGVSRKVVTAEFSYLPSGSSMPAVY